MSKELKCLWLVMLGYAVSKGWTRLEESKALTMTFPFNPYNEQIWLNERVYYSYILQYTQEIFNVAAMSVMLGRYYTWFLIVSLLSLLSIIDFILICGEPFIYIGKFPVEYDLLKGIFLVWLCFYLLYREICVRLKVI